MLLTRSNHKLERLLVVKPLLLTASYVKKWDTYMNRKIKMLQVLAYTHIFVTDISFITFEFQC